MCTIAAHDLLGARLLPTGSLGPGTPLYSNPGALGYEEEALAQVRECGGATMVRGSLLEKADCSAIPGDCCSRKGIELPLAAGLVQMYGGLLTEFVGEQLLYAGRIDQEMLEITPPRDSHYNNSK